MEAPCINRDWFIAFLASLDYLRRKIRAKFLRIFHEHIKFRNEHASKWNADLKAVDIKFVASETKLETMTEIKSKSKAQLRVWRKSWSNFNLFLFQFQQSDDLKLTFCGFSLWIHVKTKRNNINENRMEHIKKFDSHGFSGMWGLDCYFLLLGFR